MRENKGNGTFSNVQGRNGFRGIDGEMREPREAGETLEPRDEVGSGSKSERKW